MAVTVSAQRDSSCTARLNHRFQTVSGKNDCHEPIMLGRLFRNALAALIGDDIIKVDSVKSLESGKLYIR